MEGLVDFGWLDFSAADMKRTKKALSELNSGSIDELGISIIRDGFADKLFPGLSVVQTSLKYFLLIPVMLSKAERKLKEDAQKENNRENLFRLLEEKLIELQCIFCDNACKNRTDSEKINIIGNSSANRKDIPYQKRLVRFPHSIYWNGLYTFGLVDFPTMREYSYQLIERMKTDDNLYWKKKLFPLKADDILYPPKEQHPLELSKPERDYLLGKIKTALQGRNTLLEELIENPERFILSEQSNQTLAIAEALRNTQSEEVKNIASMAAKFSIYMRCAFLGFNIAWGHEDKEQFLKEIHQLKETVEGFSGSDKFLDTVAVMFDYQKKKKSVLDCMKNYFQLLENDSFSYEEIRKAMIPWENAAKGSKAYLEKSDSSEKKNWVGMKYLDFRLITALKLFGGKNGSN